MLINPSMIAANSDLTASLVYKDQWRSVTVPFTTYGASFEMKLKMFHWERISDRSTMWKKIKNNGGIGLSFYRDKAGDAGMSLTQGNFGVSSQLDIGKNSSIGGGISGSFVQRSIAYEKIMWDNQYNGTQYDPTLPSGETNRPDNFNYGDFAAGVFWKYGKGEMYISSNNELKANVGFAVYHINTPKYSFLTNASEKLYRKYVFHGGSLIGVKNSNVSIASGFLCQIQGPSTEFLAGVMLKYRLKEDSKYTGYVKGSSLGIGTAYRYRDAISPTLLLEFGQYAIGLSYDINISKLNTVSNMKGGFEIALRFSSPNPFLYSSNPLF